MPYKFFKNKYNSILSRWRSWTAFYRFISFCGLLILVGLVFTFSVDILPENRLIKFFSSASSEAQLMIFVFILILWFGSQIYSWNQGFTIDELKKAKSDIETTLTNQLQEKEERILELEETNQSQRLEIEDLQSRWDHLLADENQSGIWQRKPEIPPEIFIPKRTRKTRFLTMLNLKGGVGKTTICANLGAALAMEHNRKVLVVDLDFQGTLGEICIPTELLSQQYKFDAFTHKMFDEAFLASDFAQLIVSVRDNIDVIPSRDKLDDIEFAKLAKFYLDSKLEPRFDFLKHFHNKTFFELNYHWVIFDCPPRITVSVVNALTCSDYVLIPTRLDMGSIDAIRRTFNWIDKLGSICHLEILGVVANHVRSGRGQPMTNYDSRQFERLRDLILPEVDTTIFVDPIRTMPESDMPCVGINPRGIGNFDSLVREFLERTQS